MHIHSQQCGAAVGVASLVEERQLRLGGDLIVVGGSWGMKIKCVKQSKKLRIICVQIAFLNLKVHITSHLLIKSNPNHLTSSSAIGESQMKFNPAETVSRYLSTINLVPASALENSPSCCIPNWSLASPLRILNIKSKTSPRRSISRVKRMRFSSILWSYSVLWS